MNIEIDIDPLAIDTIKRAAHRFCDENSVDIEALKESLSMAYNTLRFDKSLTFANVLKAMSRKMLDEAKDHSIPPMVAELFNNWYLAFAIIEEIDQEHKSNMELDDLFNGQER